jgi:hypothetical protein
MKPEPNGGIYESEFEALTHQHRCQEINPMNQEIKEAIKLLLPYVDMTFDGVPTGYGTVHYCTFCRNHLNAGSHSGHLPDCKGQAAKKVLEEAVK